MALPKTAKLANSTYVGIKIKYILKKIVVYNIKATKKNCLMFHMQETKIRQIVKSL